MEKYRRQDIDILKGIAVIGVFLYHFGICRSGYLGVDVFLVISGFLTIPKIMDRQQTGDFRYIPFIKGRLRRLWPLTILITLLVLATGYGTMMPVDYQNLAENAAATFFFANNLLQYFLGGDYWDVRNEFKPLMHTWYLGVLFAFYLFISLFLSIVRCFSQKKENRLKITLWLCTLLSFLLFLFPFKAVNPFYFLHTRLFEFMAGGLVGLGIWKANHAPRRYDHGAYVLLVLLLSCGIFGMGNGTPDGMMAIGAHAPTPIFTLQNKILLPLTVFLTAFILHENRIPHGKWKILSYLGTRSFEIFLWQQPIFAFYRYLIDYRPTFTAFVICTLLTLLFAAWSYSHLEKKIAEQKLFLPALAISVAASVFCFTVYKNSGVVRDIPELDVKVKAVPPHFNTAYVDRIYTCQADFTNAQSANNVLLVGNSFARDFGNILLESDYGEQLNISYYPDFAAVPIEQTEHCDYLFVFGYRTDIPEEVWNHLKDEKRVYGIGTKNFGMSNGFVYSRRYTKKYYETTVLLPQTYVALNEEWKKEWGGQYLDLLAPIKARANEVYVFTPEHKLLSPDCRHLTKAGASYYAHVLPLDAIFKDLPATVSEKENNHENTVCGNR